jgi:Effector Associated Constant Component 1
MPLANDDKLQIEVPPELLPSLADWLNSEDVLRGRIRPVRPAPEQGKMGAAIELLSVALGSGGAGAVLVRSISTWLAQRHSEVSVSLKDDDGREFRFSSKSPKQDPSEVFREASVLFASLRDNGSDHEQAGR